MTARDDSSRASAVPQSGPATPSSQASGLSPMLAAEVFEQSLLVAPTLDMRDIGARLLAPLVHAFGASRASIMIVNPETGRLRVIAGVGIPNDVIGRDTEWRPNSISEWVYRKRQGLVLNGEVRGATLSGTSEEAIESALSVPLETAEGVVGVVNLARKSPAPVFTEAEMIELHTLLSPVGAAVERATRARHSESLATQLQSASGLVGHALLKAGASQAGHYEFGFARASSALEGGDFCEHIAYSNGASSLLAADVSGHGAQALLAAAYTLGVFVGNAASERSAAGMVARLNTEIYQRHTGAIRVALWTAQLSPDGQLSSCNAGYPAPLWIPSDDGRVLRLAGAGAQAGAHGQGRWDEEHIGLMPGDVVVAVSNGVLEAKNVIGLDYGAERLVETACEVRHQPLDTLADTILRDALTWSGRAIPTDDLVVIALRYSPGE